MPIQLEIDVLEDKDISRPRPTDRRHQAEEIVIHRVEEVTLGAPVEPVDVQDAGGIREDHALIVSGGHLDLRVCGFELLGDVFLDEILDGVLERADGHVDGLVWGSSVVVGVGGFVGMRVRNGGKKMEGLLSSRWGKYMPLC
jgi:hypothetical protein